MPGVRAICRRTHPCCRRLPPCRALIEGECVDVDDFPAGTLFVSNDFSTAGNLTPIK